MNPNYLAMVRGTRELHRLYAAGKDDSPEADAIREATDRPWESLSEVERQRVRNLAEDLYSLSEPPPVTEPMNPQAQARLGDVFEARQRGEWDRSLDLLRRWRAYVDPAIVSYLRGAIWLEAGDPETAVLFYEHASKLQPENGNYLSVLLHALDRVDPTEAQERSDEILHDPDRFPPGVVFFAADIVLRSSLKLIGADANYLFRRLIPILQATLRRIKQGDESGFDRDSYAMTIELLGRCHEFLGETQAALDLFSEGLRVDPDNDGLLVARGMLLYGTSPRAMADFELAIQRGSPAIWPYFYLAHNFLVSGRFQECLTLCERAIERPGSDAAKSELYEWLAISQTELGFPVEIIRKSFETAIRLDPGNDRAQHNRDQFDAAVRPAAKKVWMTRSAGALRTSGLAAGLAAGVAERRYASAA